MSFSRDPGHEAFLMLNHRLEPELLSTNRGLCLHGRVLVRSRGCCWDEHFAQLRATQVRSEKAGERSGLSLQGNPPGPLSHPAQPHHSQKPSQAWVPSSRAGPACPVGSGNRTGGSSYPNMAARGFGFLSLRGGWILWMEGRPSSLKQVHSKF